MMKIFSVCVRFTLKEIDSSLMTFVYRYDFEQWRQNDKNIKDQKMLDKLEGLYKDWLENQKDGEEF